MKFSVPFRPAFSWLALLLVCGITVLHAAPVVLNPAIQIRLLMNANNTGSQPVRLAKDPRNNQLYYLKINGDIFRINLQPPGGTSSSTQVYSSSDHGLSGSVQGFAIGPDGTIYVLANSTTNTSFTYARIMKGIPNASGGRIWSLLARTEPYPRSQTAFDHLFNGLIVSP